MKRLLVFGLSLMVLGVTAIHAGIGAKNGEIGFDFGATQFDTSVTDTTGGRFVFRVGYHFTDLFQLEGHLASSVGTESFLGVDLDTTLTTVMVNAVFNFHPENDSIVPYVLFGVGTANGEQEIIGLTLRQPVYKTVNKEFALSVTGEYLHHRVALGFRDPGTAKGNLLGWVHTYWMVSGRRAAAARSHARQMLMPSKKDCVSAR